MKMIYRPLLLLCFTLAVSGSCFAADIAILDSNVYTREFFSRHYAYCGAAAPNVLGADEYRRYFMGWQYVLNEMKTGNPAKYAYTIIHDADVSDSGLAPFKLLILSNTVGLSDDQTRAIRKWVLGGGGLIATFGAGYKDIIVDPRQADQLKLQDGGTGSLHSLWHDPLSHVFSTLAIDPAHPEYGNVDISIVRSTGPAAGIAGILKGYGSLANLLTQRPENNPDVFAMLTFNALANWSRPQPAVLSTKSGRGATVYYAFAPELIVSLEFDLAGHCGSDRNYPPYAASNLFGGRSAQLRPLMKSTIEYLLSM